MTYPASLLKGSNDYKEALIANAIEVNSSIDENGFDGNDAADAYAQAKRELGPTASRSQVIDHAFLLIDLILLAPEAGWDWSGGDI